MATTVTSQIQGITISEAVKAPVRAVSTTNLTLSGLQTVGGVALATGDRVLVKAQTNAANNGIYNASTSSWTRSKDFDGIRDVVKGTIVIDQSSTNVLYRVTTENPIVIGTSLITFEAVGSTLTQADIGAILYPITPAETAASVTPTGYFIDTTDYTNVMRYVSNTIDGVNSQAAAFQSAINIARISGAAITVPTPALGGSYILDVPLDCTLSAANAAAGIGNAGFTIRGTGNVLAVTPNVTSPARCAIIAKHTGHIFDCTGSLGINFENLSIGTNVTTYPKTCFLFARYSAAGPGGSIHRINNCRVMGNFSESIVYNYGAEDDIYLECQFFNRAGTANAKVFYFTSTNIRALTSSFTAIATGTQSTLGHLIQGGAFYNKTNHANGDVAYSDTVQGLRVNSAWLACGDATGAHPRSIFYFDGTNGPSNIVRLRDLIVENTAVGATYAIALSGGASTFANWVVDGCQLLNGTNAMFADIGIAFSDLNWRGNGNSSVGGGLSLQSVTNSNIEELLMPVSIVTSTNNVIKANSTALTVTSRVGDTWIDSATRTWTPGTGALTVVGALTVNNQRFEYLGKTVKATFVMSAVTSIACAAGTAITGLPRAVTIGGGEVNVTNLTTGALIPGGSVSGSSILLPAIGATGNTLAVTATYFVA